MGVASPFPDLPFMSPGLVAATYRAMRTAAASKLEDALDLIGWDLGKLAQIESWYDALSQNAVPLDHPAHFELLAYFLRRCSGAETFRREMLECELGTLLSSGDNQFGFPLWMPSVAALRGRKLWVPLFFPELTPELRAYAGLVHHLRELATDPLELHATSILWRVAALSDGLAPGKGVLEERLNHLQGDVCRNEGSISTERPWWGPLQNTKFVPYRHALTHMVNEGKTRMGFAEAAEYALGSLDDLFSAASAIGCAVILSVVDSVSPTPPGEKATSAVMRKLRWAERLAG